MTVAERTPLVEMRDISVAFGGVHAVRDVTIELHAGEVVGLVGGNGAGKSTLMRVLSGAHPADSGAIRIDGRRGLHPEPTRRQGLQHRDDLPDARPRGQHRRPRQPVPWARAADAPGHPRRVGHGGCDPQGDGPPEPELHANFAMPVVSLSGGQRQAVAIARAVHFNARILIMDEPTAALGPAETAQVREPRPPAQGRGHRHLPDQPRHPRRVRPVGPDQRHVPRADRGHGRQGRCHRR